VENHILDQIEDSLESCEESSGHEESLETKSKEELSENEQPD